MTENEMKKTAGAKTANFLEKNKKGLVAVLAVLVVLLVGYVVYTSVSAGAAEKNLSKIDEISYELTNGSAGLDENELNARRSDALAKLAQFASKGGVSGVRANLLCAEIAFQQKDYENAVSYWRNAAKAGKKSYTAPLAYFNMAVCYENLDNLSEAAANYKIAADSKDFIMKAHAKFNYGRVLEAMGKYSDAVAAYTELNDQLPDDSWAKLAKTRIITLQTEGKAE